MPDPDRRTISATQSPALWNASPYVTRWMLYQHFANGLALGDEGDARMDWGKKLQPLIIDEVAAELHFEVEPNIKDIYHRRGLLGCTRDAMIICPDRGPGALETKCVFDYEIWMRNWGGGRSIPKQHEIQLQQQMLVGDGDGEASYEWGVIAAWVCADLYLFERKPITDLWNRLNSEADIFFRSVTNKEEPEPFGAPIEVPWLTALFPTVPEKVLDLSTEYWAVKISEDVSIYKTLKEQAKAADNGAETLRSKLLALAKDNERVMLPCGVNFRVAKSGKGKYIKPFVPDVLSPTPAALLNEAVNAG